MTWSPMVHSGYPRNHPVWCMCETCDEVFRYHNDGSMCRCNGCNERRKAGYAMTRVAERGRETLMAMVALCDRCGHMGLSTTFGTLMWRFTDSDQQSSKNVCPGCVAEFFEFVQQKGGERPSEPYREPFRIVDPQPQESESFVDSLAARLLAKLEKSSRYGKELESGQTTIIREPND